MAGRAPVLRIRNTKVTGKQNFCPLSCDPRRHLIAAPPAAVNRAQLVKGVSLPNFPAKKWFGNSEPKVIEERRIQLQL